MRRTATARGGRNTLSLHDALPIWSTGRARGAPARFAARDLAPGAGRADAVAHRGRADPRARDDRRAPRVRGRSEEHTSELQSRRDLVCRLMLEKKKHLYNNRYIAN